MPSEHEALAPTNPTLINASPRLPEGVELDDGGGHCPGYDYACESASPAESQCLLNVFESMSQPCGLFTDAPQCALGVVTETGWGSCQVQDCLNLTTFEACYSNLEVLCSFSAP